MSKRTDAVLAARVLRALDLAERVTAELLDAGPSVDLSALESPRDKILAETALLLRVAAAVPPDRAPNVARRTNRVAVRLRRHASSVRVQAGIVLHPALARDYALAHRCLAAMGYPDPAVEALVEQALRAPNAASRERVPHRELEQAWIDQLAGPPLPAAVARSTALGCGVDVITGSRDNWYALTHAVLYATDLGLRAVELPRHRSAVLREAESLLAGTLDGDDFDLAGEVLMAWPMLGEPWSPVASFAFDVLCGIEDEIGLLPSLAIDGAAWHRHSGRARQEFALATSYHTVYVMGLLCATILRQDSARATPPKGTTHGARVRPSDVLIADRSPTPRWQSRYESLTAREQAILDPFVFDVAIRRAIRQFDFGVAQQMVVRAAEHGIWTAAVEQAAGLLQRARHLDLESGTQGQFADTVTVGVPH